MKSKIKLLNFNEWYAAFVLKYHKPIVGVFIFLTISLHIISFFICSIPLIDDIREEFVVRGTTASGRSLQYHNLKSLSTHRIDFQPENVTHARAKRESPSYMNETINENMENETSKPCSEFGFNFKLSKRIIIKIPTNSSNNTNEFSTYEEMLKLCSIENEIKSNCAEDCVMTITKAEVYSRILGKANCSQMTKNDVILVNGMIQNFTQTLMSKDAKYSFSISECWIMRFLYYIIPLNSSNVIELNNPGVSMIFFSEMEMKKSKIGWIKKILHKRSVQILGTKVENENKIVQEILKLDLSKEIYIFGTTLVLLFCCSKSVMITIFTFFIMCDAILVSYVIYTNVFQIGSFPFINFLNLIILVALGADDIIVYTLKWNRIKTSRICEQSKILKTIASSMPTIFATSFSTALSLMFCFTSSIVAIKCFACYGVMLISIHFLLIFSFLPAVCYLYCSAASVRRNRFHSKAVWISQEFCRMFIFDRLSHFFVSFIVKFYRALFCICLLIFIFSLTSVFFYPKLTYPNHLKNEILRLSHPHLLYNEMRNNFTFERSGQVADETKWVVNLVWGVKDDDNRAWLDLNQFSPISINRDFNMSNRDSIDWLIAFCDVIDNNVVTPAEIRHFINHRKQRFLSNCPFDKGIMSIRKFVELYNCSSKRDFYNRVHECIDKFNENEDSLTSNNFQFYYQNDVIVGFIIRFDVSISRQEKSRNVIFIFQTIENWFMHLLNSSPKGLKAGFVVFQSQEQDLYLLYSAIEQYLPMSLGLAFLSAGLVGFLVLWDWKLTGIMLFVLLIIISVSVASLVWFDWKIGIVESAIFTISTGIGIDFCLHFSIAYYNRRFKSISINHAISKALSDVFWPVTLTAITTCLPGIPLIDSHLMIFNRLAVFLFVVTFWSSICVLLLFPSCVLILETGMCRFQKRVHHFNTGKLFDIQLI